MIFCHNLCLGRQVVNLRTIHRLWSTSRPQIIYKIPPQSIPIRLSQITPVLLQQQHKFFATSSSLSLKTTSQDQKVVSPFAVDERSIQEDILIYSYNNDRFYKLMTFFGIVQFFFWVHLAGFAYTTLRDVDPAAIEREHAAKGEGRPPWWKRINLGKDKYRYGIAVLCISLGYLVLFVSVIFPKRAIKELVLKKGGKMVQMKTFGRRSVEHVPVGSINCLQLRSEAKSQIPLKIKDKWFYFLLDSRGVFHDGYLFDYLIGLKRSLK